MAFHQIPADTQISKRFRALASRYTLPASLSRFLSGDALYEGELYDGLPDSDRRAYRATMARIAELPARLVCAGHGEPLARAAMRAIALDYVAAYDRDGSA